MVALAGMRCMLVRMKVQVRVRFTLVLAAVTTAAMVAWGGRLEAEAAVPAVQAAALTAAQAVASAPTAEVSMAGFTCQAEPL